MPDTQNWVAWALLSASFAALTAIFAKVGLERVDPDYATLVRTAVILLIVAGMVGAMGKWQDPHDPASKPCVPGPLRRLPRARPGCATFARFKQGTLLAWRPSTS